VDSHQEHVLREVAQKNIRFIRLWFTDVAGVLKSISIDPGELEDAFAEGIGFDGSAVVGEWLDKTELGYPERPIAFSLRRDGEVVQEADSSEMIHSFDALIAYVSRFQTLRMGDLIFTGTPAGVGPIAIGQTLEGFIGERKVLHVPIK